MRNLLKIGVFSFLGICIISIIRLIFLFEKTFSDQGVSIKIENWGQTGDFFGGVLNPIISLMSFAVLAYLTWTISEGEKARHKQSIAPLPDILIDDSDLEVFIRLRNFGLGPMIIKSIVFKNSITTDMDIFKFIPKVPERLRRNWWNLNHNRIIQTQDQRILLSIQPQEFKITGIPDSYQIWLEYKPKLRAALKDVTVEVIYNDNIDPKEEHKIFKKLDAFND